MRTDIFKYVSRDELIKWTMDMVAIPSYSGLPNQEAEVAAYIKNVFDNEDIPCTIRPLKNGRCNVYATLKGSGGGKSLMYNGHMDTVPAYGMEDAYTPWIDDDQNIHGRGTTDMKGPIAAMMGALIAWKRSGEILPGDVIFCGVADEEEASIGTIAVLEDGILADAAIVGEPMGDNAIAISQKGLEWYQVDFHGRTVHGGQYRKGIDAIEMAVKYYNKMQDTLVPEIRSRYLEGVGESTINIGVIQGGTQCSTVAGDCYIQLDRRFLPGVESYEDCCGELQAVVDELNASEENFNATIKVLDVSVMQEGYVHQGFIQNSEDPLVKCAAACTERISGTEPEFMACPCWTDAGLLAHYGHIPVVVLGPGEMEYAHSSSEIIAISALEKYFKIYTEIMGDFCR
ncbi:MAG: ArgE/DapE family deacylase [Firmicutes bacterium]|nr:ArgE/DapE family deacylase [Bacillota bacterium]